MSNQHTTLRVLLTQTKPNILYNRPRNKETRNEKWPRIEHAITAWGDFNLTNLNESYGRILDLPIPEEFQLPPSPSHVLAEVSIDETRDIRHLTCWNNQIIQPTVDFAKRQLGIQPGIGLIHTASTVDNKVLAKLPVTCANMVDHIIMLDDFQPLVVGIGRATRWSARKLMRQLPNPNKELLWPLRQLSQICMLGQTRYGYIQTTEELAVFRFSMGSGLGDNDWRIAIQSIPWARSGCDALTTDLALWWLCMLAISGQHHRAIIREDDIVSISAWDVIYLDEERGWVRRHRYSNIEVPTSPPPPPAYQILTSGNIVNFEAEVALDAGDDFNFEAPHMEDTVQADVSNNVIDLDYDVDFDFDFNDANLFSERNIANPGQR